MALPTWLNITKKILYIYHEAILLKLKFVGVDLDKRLAAMLKIN